MPILRPNTAGGIGPIVGYLPAHKLLSIGRRIYRLLKDRDDVDMTRATSQIQCCTPVFPPYDRSNHRLLSQCQKSDAKRGKQDTAILEFRLKTVLKRRLKFERLIQSKLVFRIAKIKERK
jgi:hypothetical protein